MSERKPLPKIGEEIRFSVMKWGKTGGTLTSHHGIVKGARTVVQLLVLRDGQKRGEFVDFEVIDEVKQ